MHIAYLLASLKHQIILTFVGRLKECTDETRTLKSLYNKSLHLAKEEGKCVNRLKQLLELVQDIRLYYKSNFQ